DPSLGRPGTLYLGDVGWNAYEEIDIARDPGLNFGWPCNEGPKPLPPYRSATPAHCGCDSTGTFDNPAPALDPAVIWHHVWPDLSTPQGLLGNASVSGSFYTGGLYPTAYRGRFFFADFGQ